MDEAVRSYIDAVDPAYRPLFDRVHELIMAAHPEATVVLSYRIPTYKVGKRRLFVGAWQRKGALLKLDSDKPGAKAIWKGDRDSSVYPISRWRVSTGPALMGT